MSLHLVPISLRDARRFVDRHHRHNLPPSGWKFGVGLANDQDQLIGVAIAGRPVARGLDDGHTLEITRTCTDGTPNANSMLYGAICRAAAALGYRRVVTYTLASESGSSLRAAGFTLDAALAARPGWDMPGRRRQDLDLFGTRRPIDTPKRRWVREVAA